MKGVGWSAEDIDMLIDMLDDPLRKWFAAWELRMVIIGGGEFTLTQTERIAELVGVPRLDGEVVVDGEVLEEQPAVAYSRIDIRDGLMEVWSDNVPFDFEEVIGGYQATDTVEPFWQAGTYLFEREDEAQAYADLRAWKKRVKRESKKS
jgi:hypothetical protein